MIRKAKEYDLRSLQAIETLAGEAFRGIGMDSIADDDPPRLDDLRDYMHAGRAWVSTDSLDSPIAYILVDELDQGAHIAQVTVHPRHARQGIGRALVEEVERWAAGCGLEALTLTTFSEVPWNAPYYARMGFTELPESSWSEEMHRMVEAEASHGLSAWPRVVMKRKVTGGRARPFGRSAE